MCFTALAESGEATENTRISVGNTTGNAKDAVFVPVILSGNPGIADFVLTLNFDKSALKYKGYYEGILSDYAVYDRAEKGNVALVSLNGKNKGDNGDIIIFEFEIDKKAKAGSYKFTLSNTGFSDENGKSVKVNTENGTLKVSKSCDGEHEYLGWSPVTSSTCTNDGISIKTCRKCGHTEIKTVPATGHNLDGEFTVDIIAKDKKPGMLSRHCRTCGAKTSVIVYDEKNTAALSINDVAKKLDDSSIANLIYFLNGGRNYPDITDDDFDIATLAKNKTAAVNEKGEINIAAAVDHVLRKFFGNNKKSGALAALKHDALANVTPLKLIKKFIILVFCL